MSKKILIAAGGTGGHLIPAQQLATQLQDIPGMDVLFGGYKLQESPYFQQNSFRFAEIDSSASIKRPSLLIKGTYQAWQLIRKEKPDVVVGFGSYHSAPVLLAAALLRKKIFLYEANRTMGKVNRWMAPFAQKIGCQFPLVGTTNEKFVRVPLLPWGKFHRAGRMPSAEAKASYGLDGDRFTLLVFGGSQGAAFLNEIMPTVANRMNVQVIHCAGNEIAAEIARRAYIVPAVVKAIEKDMRRAYSAADFVVCRSGAGTLAELIQFTAPALLIPYPFAADQHQQVNAEYLCELGGSIALDQSQSSVDDIIDCIHAANVTAMQRALASAARQNESLQEFYQLVTQ